MIDEKSATDRYLKFLDALSERNEIKLQSLLTTDAVFKYPYALPGMPSEIRGLEKILDHISKRQFVSRYSPKSFRMTKDQFLVAEIEAVETFIRTNKELEQNLLCITRIDHSQISFYQEYFNPIIRLEGLLNLEKDESIL